MFPTSFSVATGSNVNKTNARSNCFKSQRERILLKVFGEARRFCSAVSELTIQFALELEFRDPQSLAEILQLPKREINEVLNSLAPSSGRCFSKINDADNYCAYSTSHTDLFIIKCDFAMYCDWDGMLGGWRQEAYLIIDNEKVVHPLSTGYSGFHGKSSILEFLYDTYPGVRLDDYLI